MAAYGIAFITIGILSPDLLIYLVIGKDTPFVRNKKTEKVIFLCCKAYLTAVAVYLPAPEILLPLHVRCRHLLSADFLIIVCASLPPVP